LTGLLPSYRDVTHQDDYTATISDLACGLGRDYDIPDILAALDRRGTAITLR